MIWRESFRADPFARAMADRHYNRQKVGAAQFVPPGRCLVLTAATETGQALWVTSWPFAEYTKHAWAGAWICSAFRNEGAGVASEMIWQALAATRAKWPETPDLGLVTFLNPDKVRPTIVRGCKVWGWTWRKVGFEVVGETGSGLMALQLRPENMPEPAHCGGGQLALALAG